MAWLVDLRRAGRPRRFLGPLAAEFLTFADPDRVAIRDSGLERLPAFVWLKTDLTIGGAAEGLGPATSGKALCDKLAEVMSWKAPAHPRARRSGCRSQARPPPAESRSGYFGRHPSSSP